MYKPSQRLALFLSLTLWAVCSISYAQVCGDAALDFGESCDDGNAVAGDGCSATCQIETGYECTLPVEPTLINGIAGGGFEDGTPNPSWTEASVAFGTPLCTETECGTGNGTGPRSGNWWAWFGGSTSTETASLEQQLIIESSDNELVFWMEVPRCDSVADFLTLTIDGNEVFRIEGDDSLCGQIGYSQQTIDLATATGGPYNDDASHTFRFEVQTFGLSGNSTNIFIDDVKIDRGLSNPIPSVCTGFDSCFSESFDPGTGALPAGWTIFEQAPQSHNWGTTDDGVCGSGPNGDPGNFTGGNSVAACVDSDAAGSGVYAYLCSDAIDLTSATGSRLRFLYNYQVFQSSAEDIFDVLIGTNTPVIGNMDTYTNVFSSGGTNQGASFATPGEIENLGLTAFQGSTVYVCFHYGADDDYYAQLDDIEVRAESCDGSPPPAPPEAPPANVSATDATYTDKVRITWDDVADETAYRVYRCSSSSDTGTCSQIVSTAGNIISYDDTTANADGTIHYYRLKACNAVGCSVYSPADAGNRKVVTPPPDAPGNVNATDSAYADKVRVSWSDVSSEDGYLVYRCVDGTDTNTCTQIATPNGNVTSYDDTGADASGTIHYYRLKACSDADGCSGFSVTDAGNRLQLCGDATLGIGEQCDDGNDQAGDGCSATCQVETGYECTLPANPALINGIADGGFESGTPNPSWIEASVNFGTPLCDGELCGNPAGGGPKTGNWWAWFGGSNDPETSSLEQQLVIEDSDAELGFWVKAQTCDSASDTLSLTIDGNELFVLRGDDASCGVTTYARQTIDLVAAAGGPYNDNTSHTMRWDAQTLSTSGGASSFFIDDIVINRGTAAVVPSVCTAFSTCFDEDFDPGTGALPAGWTIFEQAPQSHNWGTTDDGVCGSGPNGDPGNFTGGNSVAACVDSDAAGSSVDAYLCSDAIDLSSATGSRLRFLYNYQVFQSGAEDIFDVLIGTNIPNIGNMDTYTNVFSSGGTNQGASFATPGEIENLDLSAFQGSTVYVCFHYGADDDYYAQLDDIEVRAESCDGSPPPAPPEAPPANVSATDATYTDKVRITWNDVADETAYRVYRCSNSSDTGTCSQIVSTAGNIISYDDTTANADGTIHYYRLKACNAVGCSAFSPANAGNRQVIGDLIMSDSFEG